MRQLLDHVYSGVIMLRNKGKPFIIWASARTASLGLYYDYKVKNDQVGHETKGHIPLEKDASALTYLFDNNYSFCYHLSGYNHIGSSMEKAVQHFSQEQNYHHIILYREDAVARYKSTLFALATGAWHSQDRFVINDAKWDEHKDRDWVTIEKEIQKHYFHIKEWLDNTNQEYDVVEFNDAIKYISSYTGNNNHKFYEAIPENPELEKELEKLNFNYFISD